MNKLKGFPDNNGETCCYKYKLKGFPLMTIMVKLWNVYFSLKFFTIHKSPTPGEVQCCPSTRGHKVGSLCGGLGQEARLQEGMSVLIYNVLGGIVGIRSPLLYTLEIPIRIVDKGTSPNLINPCSLNFCVLLLVCTKPYFLFHYRGKEILENRMANKGPNWCSEERH